MMPAGRAGVWGGELFYGTDVVIDGLRRGTADGVGTTIEVGGRVKTQEVYLAAGL